MPNFTLKFTDKLKRGRDRAPSSSCGASQGLARRDTHTGTASSADASTSTSISAGTSTSSANARPSLPRADPDHPKRAGRLKRTIKAIFTPRKKEANKTPTTTPITTGATTTTTAVTDASHQSLAIQGHDHSHDHRRINTALVQTPSSSDRSVASRRSSLHRQPQLCAEELEAFEILHEALHHRSVLDATRHQRHGLYPEFVFEPRPAPLLRPILGCLPPPLVSISAQGLSRSIVATAKFQTSLSLAPASLAKRHTTRSVTSSGSGPREVSHHRRDESAAHRIASEVNSIPFPRIRSRYGSSHASSRFSTGSPIVYRRHMRSSDSGHIDANREPSTALDAPASAAPSRRSMRYSTVRRETASWENVTPPIYSDSYEREHASLSTPRIPTAADMRVLRFLAEGTSGKVYHVEDRVTRARIALKVIAKDDKSDFMMGVLLAERGILEGLADCPWFVKLYCSWHDHAYLYMAMTVYPTDLDSELIKHDKLHPHRARFYMAELIIALTELHSRGIIHRDVKAPNILIDRTGHLVLADFGLSKDFGKRPSMPERVFQPFWPYLPEDRPTSDTPQRSAEEMFFVSWDYRGSELEMAPEIHLRQPYSFGVDFWSAAVVLYWMLTGRPPWYEEDDDEDKDEEERDDDTSSSLLSQRSKKKSVALKVIEDDLYWDEEDDVDDVTKDFLEKMLCKNPASRLIISYQMPHHRYFDDIDWPAMEARHVPAPWLPEHDVCHAYVPSSPTFVPGMPYGSGECDPYPEFTYVSADATTRAEVQPSASTKDSDESDCYEAADVFTVVVRRRTAYGGDDIVERGEQTLVAMDAADDASVDVSLEQEEEQEDAAGEEELQRGWDHTMVNPAPTSPLGPGPKRWLQAQDLKKIQSAPISTHSSLSPSPPSFSSPLLSPLFPALPPSPSDSSSTSISPSPPLPPSFSLIASDSASVEVMYIGRISSSDASADSRVPHHSSGSGSRTPVPSFSPSPSPSPSLSSPPPASRRLGAFAKLKALVSKLGKRSGNK